MYKITVRYARHRELTFCKSLMRRMMTEVCYWWNPYRPVRVIRSKVRKLAKAESLATMEMQHYIVAH